MAGATLLTRIRNPEYAVARRSVSEKEIRESILGNIRRMIQTRQGSMLTQPEFGIADVSEMVHAFPDAIALMARSLRSTIQNFEPRLTNVQVVHIPHDGPELILRFEVRAHIVSDGFKYPVKFDTSIDAARKINVK